MTWEAWFTLALLAAILLTLVITEKPPHVVMMGALTLLSVAGILSPQEALSGFSNPGLMTVAAMFIIAAGIQSSGALGVVVDKVFGQPKSERMALLRLCTPVLVLSAFLNNTPVVATMIPAVRSWAEKIDIPASKLLIPLSYASILGGTITLIGTSTNLIVSSQYEVLTGEKGFSLFSITPLGLPAAVFGLLIIVFLFPKLLPNRGKKETFGQVREFTLDVVVDPNGPLVNKTITEAGLRNLKRLFLAEIERDGAVLAAMSPHIQLKGGDRLTFAGDTDALSDLLAIRGILPSHHHHGEAHHLEADRPERYLVEAVLSPYSSVLGLSIKDSQFRDRYGAVVLAVARNGQRLHGSLGAIRLRAGDTLLLEARPNFVRRQGNSRDFLLVNDLGRESVRHEKSGIAWVILLAVVISAAVGITSILNAALIGAGAMIATRCCSMNQATRSLDLPVLITIGASFALGTALYETGAATALADLVIRVSGGHPVLVLIAVYIAVSLATESITNNSAAILMLPVVLQLTQQLDLNTAPYMFIIMMAASASFATPLGYHTNLMVYGPGGYSFKDFLRVGIPMNILMGVISVSITLLLFPLT